MTQIAKLCAAIMLGRLSVCLPVDAAVLMSKVGGVESAMALYSVVKSFNSSIVIGFGTMVVCLLDLLWWSYYPVGWNKKDAAATATKKLAARQALCWMLLLTPPSSFLGSDALAFLFAKQGASSVMDDNRVAHSFARSHIVEWIAGIGVWIILNRRSGDDISINETKKM